MKFLLFPLLLSSWPSFAHHSDPTTEKASCENFIEKIFPLTLNLSPSNLHEIGKIINDCNIADSVLSHFPDLDGLTNALHMNVPCLIDQALTKDHPFNFFSFGKAWKAQAPGLVHALSHEKFAKFAKAELSTYQPSKLISLLSFTKVYMQRSIFVSNDEPGNKKPIIQDLHKALLVAIPEVLQMVPSIGMAFIYPHGTTFFDALFLTTFPRLAEPTGGPGVRTFQDWRNAPTGQFVYGRFPELETLANDFPALNQALLGRAQDDCSLRLAMLLGGFIGQDERKKLVKISLQKGEFDIALAGLRTFYYFEANREAILQSDPKKCAQKILDFIQNEELENPSLPLKLLDLDFYHFLLNSLTSSLQSGFLPYPKFILKHFEVDPSDILAIPALAPFYRTIGAFMAPADLLTLNFFGEGSIPLCLANLRAHADETGLKELNRLIPFLGKMNSLQIFLALQQLKQARN